jgi:multicomponent K+:H+ antiporter subunit C
MEVLLALASGVLYAAGIYLMLRRRLAQLIIGLGLLSNGTNLLIFTSGGLTRARPPLVPEGAGALVAPYADPVPQALVLTAIVIAFAMTAVSIVIAIRSRADNDSDHVDGSRAEREFLRSEQRRHEEARAREAAQAGAGTQSGSARRVGHEDGDGA